MSHVKVVSPSPPQYVKVVTPAVQSFVKVVTPGVGAQQVTISGTTDRISVDNTDPKAPGIDIDPAYDEMIDDALDGLYALLSALISVKEDSANKEIGVLTNSNTKFPASSLVTSLLALKAGVNDAMHGRCFIKSTSIISHTGTTLPTKIWSEPVAGNFLQAWDWIVFNAFFTTPSVNGNNKTIRLKINTTDSLSGAVTVATYTITSTSIRMFRNIQFINTSFLRVGANTTSYASDLTTSFADANINSMAYDKSSTYYWMIEAELGFSTDVINLRDYRFVLQR